MTTEEEKTTHKQKRSGNKQSDQIIQFTSGQGRDSAKDHATDRVTIVHEFRRKLPFTTHN